MSKNALAKDSKLYIFSDPPQFGGEEAVNIGDLQTEDTMCVCCKDQAKPMVSVSLITYNHENYIGQALEGCLMQQTDFPFEILVHDDASEDRTPEIIRSYEIRWPSLINVIYQAKNQYSQGRNVLIINNKRASGKYVAFLEGDDYWTDPYKLQKQVDILEKHPECIACHHWHKYAEIDTEGNFVEVPAPLNGYLSSEIGTLRDIFANRLRIKTRTVMYRNIFNEIDFPPEWFYSVAYGDVPISMIMGGYGDFYFIDEPMAVYRKTNQGVSKNGPSDKDESVIHRYLNWIHVWELGSAHHSYKYDKETIRTLSFFYIKILYRMRKRKLKFLHLLFSELGKYSSSSSRKIKIVMYMPLWLIYLAFRKFI